MGFYLVSSATRFRRASPEQQLHSLSVTKRPRCLIADVAIVGSLDIVMGRLMIEAVGWGSALDGTFTILSTFVNRVTIGRPRRRE
jgi:hypothetical protein